MSVQLVGVYLVFATLIVPPLAVRNLDKLRIATAWCSARPATRIGLVVSTSLDLPSGPVIVWTLAALGVVVYALSNRRMRDQSVAS